MSTSTTIPLLLTGALVNRPKALGLQGAQVPDWLVTLARQKQTALASVPIGSDEVAARIRTDFDNARKRLTEHFSSGGVALAESDIKLAWDSLRATDAEVKGKARYDKGFSEPLKRSVASRMQPGASPSTLASATAESVVNITPTHELQALDAGMGHMLAGEIGVKRSEDLVKHLRGLNPGYNINFEPRPPRITVQAPLGAAVDWQGMQSQMTDWLKAHPAPVKPAKKKAPPTEVTGEVTGEHITPTEIVPPHENPPLNPGMPTNPAQTPNGGGENSISHDTPGHGSQTPGPTENPTRPVLPEEGLGRVNPIERKRYPLPLIEDPVTQPSALIETPAVESVVRSHTPSTPKPIQEPKPRYGSRARSRFIPTRLQELIDRYSVSGQELSIPAVQTGSITPEQIVSPEAIVTATETGTSMHVPEPPKIASQNIMSVAESEVSQGATYMKTATRNAAAEEGLVQKALSMAKNNPAAAIATTAAAAYGLYYLTKQDNSKNQYTQRMYPNRDAPESQKQAFQAEPDIQMGAAAQNEALSKAASGAKGTQR